MRRARTNTVILWAAAMAAMCLFTGCSQPVEKNARDGIAAASGFLQRAVTINADSCQKQPSQQLCVAIKRASQSLTVAIDALEAYCSGPGFNAGTSGCQAPTEANTKQALAAKLVSALGDLNRDITDVKALTGPLQAAISGTALLSLIGLLLPIFRGFLGAATKNDAPTEVLDAIQGAITSLERVHDTEVTRAQLEGLKVEVPW